MEIFKISKEFEGDRHIWRIVLILSLISIAAVYSSGAGFAIRHSNVTPEWVLLKHTGLLLLGLSVMWYIHKRDFMTFIPWFKLLLYLSPLLLIYTLNWGVEIGGARRWINVFGITFQTADLVRVVLIANLAAMLGSKQNTEFKLKDALYIMGWTGLICAILAVSSFSSALILGVICVLIMWIGRMPGKYLFGLACAVILGVSLVIGIGLVLKSFDIEFGRTQTVIDRIEKYAEKDLDHDGKVGGILGSQSQQREQALLAISRGGLFGQGPGNSVVKYKLAEGDSDFIFSIFLEEYGFLGALVVMSLYLALLYRGIILVQKSTRPFAGLLCIGLILSIVFQAYSHMFINVGLGPVTGQTLPLISKGGTSILFTSVALGLVLSVSREEESRNNPRYDSQGN